jgi:hypothetical protein
VAITLAQARAQVREDTGHVNDAVRLTDPKLNRILNREYRKARSRLIDVAPQLYLITSGDITMPDPVTGQEVHLSSATFAFERIHRVDVLGPNDKWTEVERASPLSPNSHVLHKFTWREEGGCLIFGPDNEVEGTFRVLFHCTPAALTADDAVFRLPHQLEDYLIARACIKVTIGDGDNPQDFEKEAKTCWDEARPTLAKRFGVHPARAGLRRVGYSSWP